MREDELHFPAEEKEDELNKDTSALKSRSLV